MARWDSVSITAHCTAQIWIRNKLPGASAFDTLRGRAIYSLAHPLFAAASALGITAPHDFCVQRHRLIDALIERLGPAQLVELGCGLSPRCLAYARASGVPCVDVDLPGMLRAKSRLAGHDLPSTYRQAALDLVASDDYGADLAAVLRRGAHTVVVAEGLLSYFALPTQQKVFDRVAALLAACGGGTFLTDVHHPEEVDRLGAIGTLFRGGLGVLTRTRPGPMIASFEEGQRMLRRAGFSRVVQHHPEDWRHLVDLPVRARGSGLRVYEATCEACEASDLDQAPPAG